MGIANPPFRGWCHPHDRTPRRDATVSATLHSGWGDMQLGIVVNVWFVIARDALEGRGEAHGCAARWSDGVAGKKTPEVDDVKNVGKVLSIDLETHIQTLRLIDIRARRGIDLKGRIDALTDKVKAIQHLLAVIL